MNELEILERQLAREREARKQAEAILEAKSLELYHANRELRENQEELGRRVRERTEELEAANERLRLEVEERTRAEEALRERTRLAELNAEIGMGLGREESLRAGLQHCAEIFLRHLDVAFFRIWTLQEAEQVLVMQASAGLYTHLNGPHGRIPVGQFKIGQIAQNRTPHLTNQVANDPLISDPVWAQREKMVAFAGHPLIVESRLVGVMALFSRSALSPTVLSHLRSVADLIAQFIDRKRSSEELKRSQKRSAAVLNAALDSIISVDEQGRILQFNPAAERTFHFDSVTVLGRNLLEVLFPQYVAGDRVAGLWDLFRGEGQQGLVELNATRKDGVVIPVEGWATSLVVDERPLFTICLRDVSARKMAESRARSSQQLLDCIRGVQTEFIADGHPNKVFERLLNVILGLTASEYGFIGEVLNGEDGQPYLKTHAITNIAWNEQTRALYAQYAESGMEFRNLKNLFGVVLTSGRAVLSNAPRTDPRSGGLPPGHPPLTAFLGLPFYLQDRLVGMIGIANRKVGYDQEIVEYLQPVLSTCATLIDAHRGDRLRRAAEEERDRFFTLPLDLLGVVGFDGSFKRVTGAWEPTLGWTQEELLSCRVRDLLHPDDGPSFDQLFCELVERGHYPFSFENRFQAKSGEYRWLSWRAVSIPEQKRIYASAKDITDRKLAEDALLDREARIRSIVQFAVDGVLVINSHGIIETFNPAAEKIFGYSPGEVLGKNVSMLMPPSDAVRHDSYLQRYLETGEPRVINMGRPVTGLHKDGRLIPLELTISEMQIAGEIRFTGIIRDISDRQRVEQELASINARLEGVLAGATQVSIIATDIDGTITLFNAGAERLLGYGVEEMVGQCTPERIHLREEIETRGKELSEEYQEEVSGFRVFLERANQEGFEEREWTYVRKDGSHVPVSLVVTPLRDANKQVVGYLGIARDVTERKRAEVELQKAAAASAEASRAKSDFLANMSHELRTPLTAVLGYTELLQDAGLPETERVTALHCIRRNGEHLLQLINDILDLSKIEAGRIEIEIGQCSPWQTILEVVSDFGVLAHAKGLELIAEPVGLIPRKIVTDQVRLRQILMNLVSNAVKFTAKGRVIVRLSMEEQLHANWLIFEVEDQGVGMWPEQLDHLFEAFYQGDSSTTRKYGGTGLGLHISKLLAIALGGDISVQSQIGIGSIFTLRLNITGVDESNLQSGSNLSEHGLRANAERQLAKRAQFQGRVLLAEDSPDNQRIISYILNRLGLEVEVAENGRIALDRILNEQFDLVFMDIQMPELDGYTVTQYARQHGCTIPIIALTAHALQSDQERCFRAGCSAYLSKPIDLNRLIATLTQFLSPASDNSVVSEVTNAGSTTVLESPEFVRLVAEYVQKLPSLVERLRGHLHAGEMQQFASLSHQIKGGSGMYGLQEVSEVAGLLESAIQEDQPEDLLRELLVEMEQAVKDLTTAH